MIMTPRLSAVHKWQVPYPATAAFKSSPRGNMLWVVVNCPGRVQGPSRSRPAEDKQPASDPSLVTQASQLMLFVRAKYFLSLHAQPYNNYVQLGLCKGLSCQWPLKVVEISTSPMHPECIANEPSSNRHSEEPINWSPLTVWQGGTG